MAAAPVIAVVRPATDAGAHDDPLPAALPASSVPRDGRRDNRGRRAAHAAVPVDAGLDAVPPDAAPDAAPPDAAPPDAAGVGTIADAAATPAPIDAPAPPRRVATFRRAGAERLLADCRFPVDPADPDPALGTYGQLVDWGPVTRHETVIGRLGTNTRVMSMYEVHGARGVYRIDGDSAVGRFGSLRLSHGDLVVLCPYALPATEMVDNHKLPPEWSDPSPPIYAYAPSKSPPVIASRFARLDALHIPEAMLRALGTRPTALPPHRTFLVWARPRDAIDAGGAAWEMEGWYLDASDLQDAHLLTVGKHIWLLIDRPTVRDGKVTVRGRFALQRLLD